MELFQKWLHLTALHALTPSLSHKVEHAFLCNLCCSYGTYKPDKTEQSIPLALHVVIMSSWMHIFSFYQPIWKHALHVGIIMFHSFNAQFLTEEKITTLYYGFQPNTIKLLPCKYITYSSDGFIFIQVTSLTKEKFVNQFATKPTLQESMLSQHNQNIQQTY